MSNIVKLNGFTRSSLTPTITVDLTWPNLYFVADDATGLRTPIKFSFTLRRQRKSERDAMMAAAFLQEKSGEEKRLDLFCLLINEPPRGFGDFPFNAKEWAKLVEEMQTVHDEAETARRQSWERRMQMLTADKQTAFEPVEFVAPEPNVEFSDETLSDRARKYFGTDEMADFVMYAMTAYDAAVVPSELLFRI